VLLNAVIITFHLIASVVLIVFILLHAGRGGGLSDMFGGAGGGAMAARQRVHRQAPWPSGSGPSHTSQCCGKTPSSSTWSQRAMAERGRRGARL